MERSKRLFWFLLVAYTAIFWIGGGDPFVSMAHAAEGEGGHQQVSYFWWVIKTSGLIGLFILILSIYFVGTVGRLFVEFRLPVMIPPELVTQTEELLKNRDFAGVYNAFKANNSAYARVMVAGMAELPIGVSEAREAMERQREAIVVDMERKISMLAVLGTLGPMIGLLGTLSGMIKSFSVIAMSDTQLKASEVAEGISEALLLTFEGVGLSVPAIYFYAVFRNRMASITTEMMLRADTYLRHFCTGYSARKKGPEVAAAPSA